MTIAVTLAGAPTRVGPGYELSYACSGFAFTAGDSLQVGIVDSATSQRLLATATVMLGLTGPTMLHGYSTLASFGSPAGPFEYAPPGTSVELDMQWVRANLSVVDSAVSAGWTWDPTGALYALVAKSLYLAAHGGTHDPMLDTILAAVTKTWPTT
jgi:hypothetical protein